jgi:hypothetical protein
MHLSSGAFKPRTDEDGVSVYRRAVLQTSGLGSHDLIFRVSDRVASLAQEAIYSQKLRVEPDPWPHDAQDRDHPKNAAHALIVGWQCLGKKAKINKARALAQAAELLPRL